MQTYVRPDIVFTHAEGVRMWDAHGKEYLDFAAGIAVNSVGVDGVSNLAALACADVQSRLDACGYLHV